MTFDFIYLFFFLQKNLVWVILFILCVIFKRILVSRIHYIRSLVLVFSFVGEFFFQSNLQKQIKKKYILNTHQKCPRIRCRRYATSEWCLQYISGTLFL